MYNNDSLELGYTMKKKNISGRSLSSPDQVSKKAKANPTSKINGSRPTVNQGPGVDPRFRSNSEFNPYSDRPDEDYDDDEWPCSEDQEEFMDIIDEFAAKINALMEGQRERVALVATLTASIASLQTKVTPSGSEIKTPVISLPTKPDPIQSQLAPKVNPPQGKKTYAASVKPAIEPPPKKLKKILPLKPKAIRSLIAEKAAPAQFMFYTLDYKTIELSNSLLGLKGQRSSQTLSNPLAFRKTLSALLLSVLRL